MSEQNGDDGDTLTVAEAIEEIREGTEQCRFDDLTVRADPHKITCGGDRYEAPDVIAEIDAEGIEAYVRGQFEPRTAGGKTIVALPGAWPVIGLIRWTASVDVVGEQKTFDDRWEALGDRLNFVQRLGAQIVDHCEVVAEPVSHGT